MHILATSSVYQSIRRVSVNAITITPSMTTGALYSRLDSVCFALLENTRFFAAAVHQHRASEKRLVSFSCEGLEVIVETAPLLLLHFCQPVKA